MISDLRRRMEMAKGKHSEAETFGALKVEPVGIMRQVSDWSAMTGEMVGEQHRTDGAAQRRA